MIATREFTDESSLEADNSLAELIHYGAARAAITLSELIGVEFDIHVGTVLVNARDANGIRDAAGSVIRQTFDGPVAGEAELLLPERSGLGLARAMVQSASAVTNLDIELRGVLLEVGNILLNGVLGSLSANLRQPLQYAVPELTSPSKVASDRSSFDRDSVRVDVEFRVGNDVIPGTLWIELDRGSLSGLCLRHELLS